MHILGVDLAKRTFDVTLLRDGGDRRYKQFPNTPTGFRTLQDWLTNQHIERVHACMEATNVYWEALAAFLADAQHIVSVVNPARIKGFAQSQMNRTKTDKQDSRIIALFCLQCRPDAWKPPSAAQRSLRALVRHRDDLLQTRTQLSNRLGDTSDSLVRESLEAVLASVEQQLTSVEERLKQYLKDEPELGEQGALLTAIVGIGAITAYKLLAEFCDIDTYTSAKALAADAGVTPAQYESGTSVRRRPHLSKVGKASVRAALYWPAITAMRRCEGFKAFAERLAARGKAKGVIIGAVMRKLLHVVYGVLKHKTPFDPNKVLGPTRPST
jgi:transposase